MIVAGDEFGHSQLGNNNPYCQDNVITWLNWEGISKEDKDLAKYGSQKSSGSAKKSVSLTAQIFQRTTCQKKQTQRHYLVQ